MTNIPFAGNVSNLPYQLPELNAFDEINFNVGIKHDP